MVFKIQELEKQRGLPASTSIFEIQPENERPMGLQSLIRILVFIVASPGSARQNTRGYRGYRTVSRLKAGLNPAFSILQTMIRTILATPGHARSISIGDW